MNTSEVGLNLIKGFESFQPVAYVCPAGKWTVGYGCTTDVAPGMRITQAEGDQRLKEDLQSAENCVNHSLPGVNLTQGEFDALVSFVFNCGCAAFRGSTMYKLLLTGRMEDAAKQFDRWVHAGGKELEGLVRRRAAERALFESSIA